MLMTSITRFLAGAFSIGMMVWGVGVVCGQTYPNKPIRMVTSAAGGGNDFILRLIAPRISGPLGQPVIVDNRIGGTIQGEIVSNAAPDGYTLLLAGGTFWIGALLQKTPYDPVIDFSAITLVAREPSILVVHPSLPVKSVKELIAFAKAKPGALNYASGGIGASSHLSGELFKAMAGVDIVRINYKGTGPGLIALLGGDVQLSFGSAASTAPHVQSGKLRALAVTTAQPSALFPGLSTVAASGLPGFESVSNSGIFAPAKTSKAIINRLNQEVARVLNTAEIKQKLLDSGVEVVSNSPEEFAATLKSEMAKWGKLIKDAGIRVE